MKAHVVARVVLTSLALVALLTTGCGKVREAAARQKKSNDMKQIGLAYYNYLDLNKGKAPANADDLMKAAGGDPQVSQVLQAVKSGQYVIIWNSTITEMQKSPGGSSSMILGYEKDAPTAGGVVLMGDGSARIVTASEFQSTPKAPGK